MCSSDLYISPFGIVRDVEVLVGKIKYPANFIVLGCPQDSFCPIIFGRPFLRTVGAKINFLKDKVFIKCDNGRLEFNFSKFADKHVVKEPISEDIIETLAHIAVASTDVVERICLIKMNHLMMRKKRLWNKYYGNNHHSYSCISHPII